MSARVPPRLVRRLLIDPLWPALAVAMAAVLTAVGLLAALAWPLTPRRRVLRLTCLAIVYLYLDLALLLGALGLWVRRPAGVRDHRQWRAMHCGLLLWALTTLQRSAHRLLGFEVRVEDGGFLPPATAAPLIVLARHAGPGDSFTVVRLILARYRRRPRVVLHRALQWDPGLDVVLTRLSGCFLPSRSGAGDDVVDHLAAVAAGLSAQDALLLFPEGGNWTPRRHRRAVAHLLRTGRRRAARQADHRSTVLPPRPAGTLACIAARPEADVVVIAHAGLDTLVTAGQMWRALPIHDRPMRITAWHHPAAAVPRDESGAQAWLDAQWTRVDAWVRGARTDSADRDPFDDAPSEDVQ